MNEWFGSIIGFLSGCVIGWIAFGTMTIEDCTKIGGFTAGGRAFVCEVKK